jgi:hypothetical protein
MNIEICENSPMNAPEEKSVVPEMAGLTPHNADFNIHDLQICSELKKIFKL